MSIEPTAANAWKRTMHAALVADGLFADEATALLSTWQRAYFASPGLRLFYLVPRQWTDHYLPLSISAESRIERVMVGRLELVSDQQRELLTKLAASEITRGDWVDAIAASPARDRFIAGRTSFEDLGVKIPADYQYYLDLGRFRNALVTHEERIRPTKSLTKFIDTYHLHQFRLPKTPHRLTRSRRRRRMRVATRRARAPRFACCG